MSKRKDCRACFENGRMETWHGAECRAYDAQTTWNKRMARILADTTPRYEHPVPEPPDYTDHWGSGPIGAAGHYAGTGHVAWTRGVYALLASDGRAYRLLKAAVARAEQTIAASAGRQRAA